ncbi:MAG TPA: hypothetical protein VE085_09115 [Burkholderiales bacterium]|nr:hypothetical protein [Burkholderiales bacterium]
MIHEPMTLATDYVLAAVSGVAGVLALRAAGGQRSRQNWGVALLALALAAAIGGTHHGFALPVLWKPTVFIAGGASAAMVVGSAFATTRGALRTGLIAFAALKLAVFWLWTWHDARFIWVVADSGIAFALVAALHAVWRDAASSWILAGVGLSLVAAGAQASGFDLHRHFNHNDLYHVIQIVALVAFYRGVRRMRDR